MAQFEDDFAKGEAAAARLAARMEAASKRLEKVDAVERKDAEVRERSRQTANEEAKRVPEPEAASSERTVSNRADYEQRVNKAIEERALLERRARAELEQTGRTAQKVLGPGGSYLPVASGGGYGGGRQPPRFFQQPPPPEQPRLPSGREQYLLNSGPQQRQISERSLAHPEDQKYYDQEARAIRERNAAGASYASTSKAMGEAESQLGPSIGRTAQFQRAANLEYQRFGALSSEWIGATARGATTINELGRQTTATIGKFGGWLGAGALLFTALDAVKAIGHGAIESASGVNQLERVIKKKGSVDPNQVQTAFRGLSQHFNLPIEDVSNAVYEMGKIFHTTNGALEASKAVLYSVKVGELDTATASRYLIAIINGFHLPANQLVSVFDQLNNAQNEFGISISDVEAGLAKASGSFNAATTKGSPMDKYHELLALIATAQKATGQTGQVVGTAIQRIPGQLNESKNKATLKKFGINAGGDVNQIIQEAFKAAQSISGHKLNELSSAIFGKQYGPRVGTPLLAQYDLYKKVLAKTASGPSKGSGETELQTQLGSIKEEISQIGVALESIGSSLAEAGFFTLLGAGVETLTLFLHVANDILEVFNKLPGPVKETLAVMIELRLAVAALRKFNLGDNFKEGSLGRKVFTAPNRDARIYEDQLVSDQRRIREKLESNNNAQLGTREKIPQAATRVDDAKGEMRALEAQRADQDTLSQQQRQINAAENRRLTLMEQDLEQTEARRELLKRLDAAEADAAVLSADRTDATAAQLAKSRGRTIPGSFNVGKMTAKELARESGDKIGPDGAVVPLSQAERETAAGAAAAAGSSKVKVAADEGSHAWRNLASSEINVAHPIESLSRAKTAAGEALTSSAKGISGFTRTAVPSLARGFRGLGSSLFDMIGPIGVLLGGVYLAIEYGDDLGRSLAGGQSQIEAAEHLTQHLTQQQRKKYVEGFEKGGTTGLPELSALHKAAALESKTGVQISVKGQPAWYTAGRALGEKRLLEAQKRALQEGNVANFLGSDVVKSQLSALTQIKPGTSHYQQAIQRLRHDIDFSDSSDKDKKKFKNELKELEAKGLNATSNVAAFFSSYNAVADKLLLAYIKNLSTLVQGGPAYAGQKDVHKLINASVVQGVRDLVSNKPAIRAKGEQTLQELPQALAAYEQQELKASLVLSRTQGGREKAYTRYINSLQRGLKQVKGAFKNRGGEVNSKLEKTEKQIEQFEKEGKGQQLSAKLQHNLGIEQGARTTEEAKELSELREKAKRLRRAKEVLSKQQQHEERELKVLIQEQREEQIQEHVGVLGELGQLASARIGGTNPVGEAQATLNYAQKALAYVRSHHGSPQDTRQAILSVLNAREQLEEATRQEASDLASAAEALAEAKANGDPILEAHAEIEKARSDIAQARTAAEKKNAFAELINAEHKLEEDRANIAIAKLGLQSAETESPVKQAAIKVREADLRLKNAHGKAAKLEARAAKADAVREQRDAYDVAKLEDVEYQANLGHITASQEIAAYTHLLHTLKLGRDAKKSLIEKIHSLREEVAGELELTVGNIALPSLYDVRRAVQGGVTGGTPTNGGGGGTYVDNSKHTYNVTGNTKEVEKAIENHYNRNVKNAKRSAGIG